MKIRTLKVKSIILVLPVIIVLASAMSYAVLEYFEHRFKESIEEQQFILVTRIAADLDNKITSGHQALVRVAEIVPPAIIGTPRAAERYLDNRPDLGLIFDNNLVIFSPEGKLIAETAQRPSRTGADFSYREYIKETRRTWKPYISPPFISVRQHRHPVVMFTAPVFDAWGNPVAIMGGSIDLMSTNFLGLLADAKIGKTGYFFLFTTDRTMVMHPDRSRIMRKDIPPGANKLLDRAISGFEGGGETVTSRGMHTLTAFKRLASVNWILGANFPTAEAYAPIRSARNTGWWIIAFGVLITAGVILLVMSRLTLPLVSLTTQIREIGSGGTDGALVKVDTSDEIGDLAAVFNNLMEQLRSKERELVKSNELFQFLSDFSTDWIFWRTPDGKMLYISPAAAHISGYSVAELLSGDPDFADIIHPDDRAIWVKHVAGANRGEEEKPIEYRIVTKQGETRWISHICRPIYDGSGAIMGVRGSNTDITERKQAEKQLRYMSTHDVLTGLYNRAYFEEEMERLCRSRRFPVSVVMADLDDLKLVNDTLGHEAGDAMIRLAADTLTSAFRGDDVIARFGGDEFSVLLPGSNEAVVQGAVGRIRAVLEQVNSKDEKFVLSISIGATTAYSVEELRQSLKVADRLMYVDKASRKGS